MNKRLHIIVKSFLIVAAVLAAGLFVCFFLLFFMGSMEACPTPEQIEKARITYGSACIILGIIETFLLIGIFRKKKQISPKSE